MASVCLLLAAGATGAEPRVPAPTGVARTHVVARGDTLGAIATRYGVSVTALVTANRLVNDRVVLRLGQRLIVPAPASPRPSAPSTARRPEPAGERSAALAPSPKGGKRVAAVPRERAPARPPARGPRGLELAVPDFVEASPEFVWPVEGPISSTFGRRRSGWHRGIDIKAAQGAVVFAAASGVVVTSAVEPRYGRVVKIEHEDGYVTVYAHNEENLVQAGMRVAPGDPIATIGRTGRATAHHLHFEIRRNGAVYNPLYLLPMPPRVGQVEEDDEPDEEHD